VSDDDVALLLIGADSSHPLPEVLRRRFERALIGPEDVLLVFHGVDAPRPVPSELHAELEHKLLGRHRLRAKLRRMLSTLRPGSST
jgi:hypothetical protein